MADEDDTARDGEESHDIVLLHGPTEDGAGLRGIRSRPGRLELAEIRPVAEGRPLGQTELVRLRRRKDAPLLCDVDVLFDPRAPRSSAASAVVPSAARSGPPQVATEEYRANWEEIFGARRKPRPPAN